jgi:hypothetical protein
MAPFEFPGTMDVTLAAQSNGFLGFRQARAQLVQHKIRTWWVSNSPTAPIVAFQEIIPDSITIVGLTRVTAFHGVLHNDYTAAAAGVPPQFFPATTPSYSEYFGGTLVGYALKTIAQLVSPGSGGASVGQTFTVGAYPWGVVSITVLAPLGVSNTVLNFTQTTLSTGVNAGVSPTTYPGAGGSSWSLVTVSVPIYDLGTRWIGNEKVIGATVSPTEIKNQWKVQTRSVIMR